MAFKYVVLACFVAVANAGVIAPVAHIASSAHYAAPVAHYAAAPVAHYAAAPVAHYAAPVAKYAYAEAPAEYNFEYSVHDEHTGDIKSQKEVRHGDSVQGSYSLIEADGTQRVVEYTADEHNGFNAVVHRQPSQHAVAYKPVVKVAAAPIVKVAAPVYAHAAPAYQTYAHAAPAYQSYAHAAPAYQTYAHAAPAYQSYAHAAPAYQSYAHAAPAYYH